MFPWPRPVGNLEGESSACQHFPKSCLSGWHRSGPCSLLHTTVPCTSPDHAAGALDGPLIQVSSFLTLQLGFAILFSPLVLWNVELYISELWGSHVPPAHLVKQVKPGSGENTGIRGGPLWTLNSLPGPGGQLSGCTNYPLSLIISPFGLT